MCKERIFKTIVSILISSLLFGTTAFAAEIDASVQIAETSLILYSNETAVLYAEPSLTSAVVLDEAAFPDDLAIQVTGITSNGFFEVFVGDTYYVPGYGLEENSSDSNGYDIVLDLGNGIGFYSPAIIDCYDYASGRYTGTVQIFGASLTQNVLTGSVILELSYAVLTYGENETDVASIDVSYLDAFGNEIVYYTVSSDRDGMPIDPEYVNSMWLSFPANTAAVIVRQTTVSSWD